MKKNDKPIVVEQAFNTSVKKVWNAISKPEQMKQWYFENIDSFKPEVGFKTRFEVAVEDRKFTHLWKLTEVIPYQKITYNWKYEEYRGDSFVTFELTEENKHVKLRLSHKVVESFPDDIPEFSRESGVQGWNYLIGKSLKEYLESDSE